MLEKQHRCQGRVRWVLSDSPGWTLAFLDDSDEARDLASTSFDSFA
jgi:hypothetical protein